MRGLRPGIHFPGASLAAMSFSRRSLLLLLSLLAVGALWSGDVRAQQPLNRCTGPSGNTIYTDKPCDAIGASERLPRGATAGAYGLRRGSCARNLQDLVYEITAAIDNRDVNRLGAVYHWVGQSAESGDRILDQLQAIVDRPLVDIVPLRGAVAEAPLPEPGTDAPLAPPMAAAAAPATPAEVDTATGAAAPQPPPRLLRRAPVGLRLEQTLGKGSTPSRTVFGLRRHLDCWWITL